MFIVRFVLIYFDEIEQTLVIVICDFTFVLVSAK